MLGLSDVVHVTFGISGVVGEAVGGVTIEAAEAL